jgi:hypothetical protein
MMKKPLMQALLFLALGAVICLPGMAAADTNLYFDDVPGGIVANEAIPLPAGYGGFTWSASSPSAYWGVLDNTTYRNNPGFAGNSFDFPSNPNVLINEDGNLGAARVMISSATLFDFDGAYFGTWTRNDTQNYYGASSLIITGLLGGTEVASTTIYLAPGPLVWYDIGFVGIDTLIFDAIGSPGRYFLMDNFTDAQVPLPPSGLLLAGGLLGLIGLRRMLPGAQRDVCI